MHGSEEMADDAGDLTNQTPRSGHLASGKKEEGTGHVALCLWSACQRCSDGDVPGQAV